MLLQLLFDLFNKVGSFVCSTVFIENPGWPIEKIFAQIAPERFNNDQTVANTPDDRSDNKGPEPEGITVGTVIWCIAGFFGVHALFASTPWLYTALKYAGGAYLAHLGLRMVIAGLRPPA